MEKFAHRNSGSRNSVGTSRSEFQEGASNYFTSQTNSRKSKEGRRKPKLETTGSYFLATAEKNGPVVSLVQANAGWKGKWLAILIVLRITSEYEPQEDQQKFKAHA